MAEKRRNEVDPELWPLVEGFPPIDLSAETLTGFRIAVNEMSPMPDPATHADITIEEVFVPGRPESGRTVRCLLFRPRDMRSPGALLHIHGGGYVMGTPEMDVERNIALARAAGCIILSVDYRLAPENPWPAGLQDCEAAALWLAGQAEALDFPRDGIGVIGESAGGGMAASLALRLRGTGAVGLACQILIFPMLLPPDASLDKARPDLRTGNHIWTRASNDYCWSAYLPDGGERGGIAGLAEDLSGLPPAFLAVGELDLFLHDNLAFVGRLLAAGVSTEAHVYQGAIHAFDRMPTAAVATRFSRELADFVVRHLARDE